jgi:hypothetical protein
MPAAQFVGVIVKSTSVGDARKRFISKFPPLTEVVSPAMFSPSASPMRIGTPCGNAVCGMVIRQPLLVPFGALAYRVEATCCVQLEFKIPVMPLSLGAGFAFNWVVASATPPPARTPTTAAAATTPRDTNFFFCIIKPPFLPIQYLHPQTERFPRSSPRGERSTRMRRALVVGRVITELSCVLTRASSAVTSCLSASDH